MSTSIKRGAFAGVNGNNSISWSSQGGTSTDSFVAVEFESLLPQATSAAIATAALFLASHTVDQTQRASNHSEDISAQSETTPP